MQNVEGNMNMGNAKKEQKQNVVNVEENIVLHIKDVNHTKERFKSKT